MATKVKREDQAIDDAELEAFIASRSQRRKGIAKRAVIVVVCIGLVLCFCLPALSMLF